jgi:DNA-directed RNA polymerase subunit beta'
VYSLPSFEDRFYGADTFGPATGAAVPLDDYDMGRDYR